MSNWWANKLSETASSSRAPAPTNNLPFRRPSEPPRAPYRPPAAVAAPPPKVEERCPGCNGVNYMSAPNSNYKRCYDCGYPLVQSGTGVSATHADAPTKSAVQVQTGGYNPSVIVGKVD